MYLTDHIKQLNQQLCNQVAYKEQFKGLYFFSSIFTDNVTFFLCWCLSGWSDKDRLFPVYDQTGDSKMKAALDRTI